MDVTVSEMLVLERDLLSLKHAESLMEADLRDLRLREENIQDLRAVQKIILSAEDNVLSLDEVLAWILAFYRRFVPYK